MSYYGSNYPEIDEIVFVKIERFSDHGIYCRLIEYEGKEGFLMDTEMEKKIYYVKNKYFNFKKVYPMLVMDIDFDRERIDLSHKRIKADERDKYIKHFDYVSKMYRLSEEFSTISKLAMDVILPLTMWKHAKKDELEASHKKFKSILQKPDSFITDAKKFYPTESEDFLDNLASRITSTTQIIYQNFDLIVYCEDAINEIKNILSFPNMETNIQLEYVNSPTYRLIVECKFNDERNDFIDNYVENQKQHKGFTKLGPDIYVEEIDKYTQLIHNRIKNKNVHFELGDMFLVKDREMNVKYLPKDLLFMQNKHSFGSAGSSIDFYDSDGDDN